MLRRVLDMKREGFPRRRVLRAENEAWRRSSSDFVRVEAEGEAAKMTTKISQPPIRI